MSMLVEGIVGSTAYGLAHAGSDKDYLGVEVYPTDDFLGIYPKVSGSRVWKDADDNDRTVHEVGKYLGLVVKANPTASELMWLDQYETLTEDGKELVRIARGLLSQRAASAYMGFAKSNIKNYDKYDTPERKHKAARHYMRLVISFRSIWAHGTMKVRMDTADKEAIYSFADAVAKDTSLFEKEDKKLMEFFEATKTPLAPEPDLKEANAFLIGLRKKHL